MKGDDQTGAGNVVEGVGSSLAEDEVVQHFKSASHNK